MARLITGAAFQRPVEQFFEEKGIFTKDKLAELKKRAADSNQPFEAILISESHLPETQLFKLLAEAYGLGFTDGGTFVAFEQLPERVSAVCRREKLMAVSLEDRNLTLATAQPGKSRGLIPLFSTLGYEIVFQVTTPSVIAAGLPPEEEEPSTQADLYSGIHSLASTLKASEGTSAKEAEKISDISVSLDTPSVSELVNKTLLLAVNQGASDIHAESTHNGARIRFRIDGVLVDRLEIDSSTASGFFSRLMIMSHLDITEKVMPQDGSFKVNCEDREVEFRIACMPGIFGQNIVLRILSGFENVRLNLETLGMLFDELEIIRSVTRSPHGMILVAGPTGSGKSTTLYSVLETLSDPRLKFITIEDPVERRIQGVQQIQVRVNRNEPERSLTFARGLRTILRLDPDIIMVGEIRDAETAQISMQASMTGHLVLSTVHANRKIALLFFVGWVLEFSAC